MRCRTLARKVYFSFHFDRDSWRVGQVRNCNVVSKYEKNPFYDKASWEAIKKKGDAAVQKWIDQQLRGTSVTVVLIGKETASRRWVKYEIRQSVALGKGLIGIDISKIKNHAGVVEASAGANPLPAGYRVYLWNKNDGPRNLGTWIEAAAP